MICPNCKKQVSDGAKFCTNCGTKLAIQPVVEDKPIPEVLEPTVEEIPIISEETNQVSEPVSEPEVVAEPEIQPESAEEVSSPAVETPVVEEITPIIAEEPISEPVIEPVVVVEPEPVVEAPALIVEEPAIAEPEPVPAVEPTPVVEPAPVVAAQPTPVVEPVPTPVAQPAPVTQPVQNAKPKKKKKGKIFGIIFGLMMAIIAIIVAAAILLTSLFFGKTNNYFLYLKDEQLYYSSVSKINPIQITDEMFESKIDERALSNLGWATGYATMLSKDGKTIFYVDKYDVDDDGLNLYYRSVSNLKKEPEKIDSDIESFAISEDGKLVTYLRDDGNLYQSNLTDKEKIDSDVRDFYVSENGKKIGYMKDEGDIYLKVSGKSKEKIDRDVSRICHINDDFNTVWYLKEDSLYKLVEGKDREKIASDVYSVLRVYDSGEIYYLTESDKAVSADDFVNDSYESSDRRILMNGEPEYPDYWDYYTWDEYYAARDEYWEDYYAYRDAYERDELREALETATLSLSLRTLNYFDGKNSTKVSDNYVTYDEASNEKAVVVYSNYDPSSFEKFDITEIDSVYELEQKIDESLSENAKPVIAIKGEEIEFEHSDASDFEISPDSKSLIYMADFNKDHDEGELYKVGIGRNKLETTKLYASDVCEYSADFIANDTIIYFKNIKDSKGDLYLNNKKADFDVYEYGYRYSEESKTLYYWVDYDIEDSCGTLKCYKNGKDVKIADEVYSYELTPGGEVLYLYDYDMDDYYGELYIYKGNKAQKIDDDVNAIVPIYDIRYGYNYFDIYI